MAAEWRRYRLCGALLVPLGIVLVGEVILLLHETAAFHMRGRSYTRWPPYTFYTITMAIINVVRYRRYNSPVMSSARVMSLASAAVSMLALEVAMLTQFGAEDENQFPPYHDNSLRMRGVCAHGGDGYLYDSPLFTCAA